MALSWVWGRDPGPAVPYCLVTDHEVAVAGHTPFLPAWQLDRVVAPKMPILCHAVPVHAILPWVP